MNKDNNRSLWEEFVKNIKKIDYSKNTFQNEENLAKKIIIKSDFSDDFFVNEITGEFKKLYHGSVDNIDRNTAKKFNKGGFYIEKILDLHGDTEEQAFIKVNNFIKSSYNKGYRCVLIITGKGKNSTDVDLFSHKAILKNSVPKWLNSDDLRGYILSFKYALPKDGGDGALQVLLKRNRCY